MLNLTQIQKGIESFKSRTFEKLKRFKEIEATSDGTI